MRSSFSADANCAARDPAETFRLPDGGNGAGADTLQKRALSRASSSTGLLVRAVESTCLADGL